MSCMMLPIHRRAFDKVTQAAVEGKSIWTWIYEDGKAAKEDAELTKQLLNSAAYVENDNQTLEALILEEAGNIFQGQGAPGKRLKEFRAGPVFISTNKCKIFICNGKDSI